MAEVTYEYEPEYLAEKRRQEDIAAGRTVAVNLRTEEYDVYIGRAGRGEDGYFGNPYRLREHGQRALQLFREYFLRRVDEDPEFRRRVLALKGKRLGCFCKPGPCHGDVIAEWVEAHAAEVAGG